MGSILERLLYLDREFISSLYESEKGVSPQSIITRTEGLNAGVQIPLFSANASSVESKAYSVSAIQMFKELKSDILTYENFNSAIFEYKQASMTCWVTGVLSATSVEVSRSRRTFTLIGESMRQRPERKELVKKESYWQLSSEDEQKFALITNKEYFSSGVEKFPDLVGSVINHLAFPVKALVRVYSARSSFEEWIAVPLLIEECDADR
ncbi:MAG: hypothetical protein CMI00_02295 [Oceanospirillaceae bacterium]|nr:hypothetical protein [Oceanospirillaceae bacterium]|tara:strand:- start:122 stop:748 length:627 start_codon:yes stop_codon:yes gene_type:complete